MSYIFYDRNLNEVKVEYKEDGHLFIKISKINGVTTNRVVPVPDVREEGGFPNRAVVCMIDVDGFFVTIFNFLDDIIYVVGETYSRLFVNSSELLTQIGDVTNSLLIKMVVKDYKTTFICYYGYYGVRKTCKDTKIFTPYSELFEDYNNPFIIGIFSNYTEEKGIKAYNENVNKLNKENLTPLAMNYIVYNEDRTFTLCDTLNYEAKDVKVASKLLGVIKRTYNYVVRRRKEL